MKTPVPVIEDVDTYISFFPEDTQKLLNQIRSVILKAAPDAEEIISYQMPSYKLHGILVHFAGYKKHIGFYPGPDGITAFKEEIDAYKNAKGSVQFPLDQKLPVALITKIVKFRIKENIEKEKIKAQKKKK